MLANYVRQYGHLPDANTSDIAPATLSSRISVLATGIVRYSNSLSRGGLTLMLARPNPVKRRRAGAGLASSEGDPVRAALRAMLFDCDGGAVQRVVALHVPASII